MCNCGEIFDLNEGRRVKQNNGKEIIVCLSCYDDAVDAEENEVEN